MSNIGIAISTLTILASCNASGFGHVLPAVRSYPVVRYAPFYNFPNGVRSIHAVAPVTPASVFAAPAPVFPPPAPVFPAPAPVFPAPAPVFPAPAPIFPAPAPVFPAPAPIFHAPAPVFPAPAPAFPAPAPVFPAYPRLAVAAFPAPVFRATVPFAPVVHAPAFAPVASPPLFAPTPVARPLLYNGFPAHLHLQKFLPPAPLVKQLWK